MTYTSIRYSLLEGNLLNDGRPTRDAVERLARETALAIAEAFPGADVEVPVLWRTSGIAPSGSCVMNAGDPEIEPEWADEERLQFVVGQAWQKWCETLSDADMQS